MNLNDIYNELKRIRSEIQLLRYWLSFIIGILIGMFLVNTITANAAPTAGFTKTQSYYQSGLPIADWQQDILDLTRLENNYETDKKDKALFDSSKLTGRSTGPHLTRLGGIFNGPSGRETWYNLPMGLCVSYMEDLGYSYEYWIRSDGVKMYGPYIMCAADLSIRPKGTILETSLGKGIVCDTGEFVKRDRYQLDVATNW